MSADPCSEHTCLLYIRITSFMPSVKVLVKGLLRRKTGRKIVYCNVIAITDSYGEIQSSIKLFCCPGLCSSIWEEFAQDSCKQYGTSVQMFPWKTECRVLWAKQCLSAMHSMLACRDQGCLCCVFWAEPFLLCFWELLIFFNMWCAMLLEWHVDLFFSG